MAAAYDPIIATNVISTVTAFIASVATFIHSSSKQKLRGLLNPIAWVFVNLFAVLFLIVAIPLTIVLVIPLLLLFEYTLIKNFNKALDQLIDEVQEMSFLDEDEHSEDYADARHLHDYISLAVNKVRDFMDDIYPRRDEWHIKLLLGPIITFGEKIKSLHKLLKSKFEELDTVPDNIGGWNVVSEQEAWENRNKAAEYLI